MKKLIINVGRQFASGGRAVARKLGEKLDFPVYDHELLSKAAEDSGFSREIFKKKDEKREFLSFKSLFSGSWEYSDTVSALSESELFRLQSETIRRIAENGSAIIVGRCADYILRDLDCTLNVFLTSSYENRIRRVIDRHKVDRKTAEEIIARKDKKRSNYYNYYTFQTWGQAMTYDLCLNTDLLGEEGTADFIIDFARKSGLLDE